MRVEIKGLAELRARLASIRPAEIMASALAEQAERLAQVVRDSLSEPPGGGPHDQPWAQTGALRDSIAAQANGLEAVVGSNDPAAAPQEMGTSKIPPRPFLTPAATAEGEAIARAVGDAVSAALRGEGGGLAATSHVSQTRANTGGGHNE